VRLFAFRIDSQRNARFPHLFVKCSPNESLGRYRWDFRRPWAEYVAEHKCAEVTPHIARHTFASLVASAGVSIYKIAQWLGDDARVVQQHYAKLLPKDADIEAAF
jgi:integrase